MAFTRSGNHVVEDQGQISVGQVTAANLRAGGRKGFRVQQHLAAIIVAHHRPAFEKAGLQVGDGFMFPLMCQCGCVKHLFRRLFLRFQRPTTGMEGVEPFMYI